MLRAVDELAIAPFPMELCVDSTRPPHGQIEEQGGFQLANGDRLAVGTEWKYSLGLEAEAWIVA